MLATHQNKQTFLSFVYILTKRMCYEMNVASERNIGKCRVNFFIFFDESNVFKPFNEKYFTTKRISAVHLEYFWGIDCLTMSIRSGSQMTGILRKQEGVSSPMLNRYWNILIVQRETTWKGWFWQIFSCSFFHAEKLRWVNWQQGSITKLTKGILVTCF